MKGTVSNFIGCLGAGYIESENGTRYFVQTTDFIDGIPAVGTEVTFVSAAGEGKRLRAKEVRAVSGT